MKISSRTLLAAALIASLPMGSALACTTSNWNGGAAGGAAAGNQKGRNSEPAVPRYSGECALKAANAGSSYVTDNSPGSEAVYRSRFYVFTGSAASGSKIFAASADDNNGGAEAFSITINNNAFNFAVNGTTVPTIPAAANKWYAVETLYRASGAFRATVRGAGAATETVVNSAGNAGAVNVGSARLGVLSATTNATAMAFDAFESTRSADTVIGRLCPGDANGDNFVNSGDALAALNEFPPSGPYAPGQPDCNEDGFVNSGDAICAINRFTVIAQRNCTAN